MTRSHIPPALGLYALYGFPHFLCALPKVQHGNDICHSELEFLKSGVAERSSGEIVISVLIIAFTKQKVYASSFKTVVSVACFN